MTRFRRAFIDRPRQRVCVETSNGTCYTLPGTYNPDAVIERVKAAGTIDLTKWERFNAG